MKKKENGNENEKTARGNFWSQKVLKKKGRKREEKKRRKNCE
jgi:hypothetical protein